MVCQVCHRVSRHPLCKVCTSQLRPAPDRLLPGGIRLVAAFEHEGPARVLIHHLKYRGLTPYADLVAKVLADRLPPLPIVPVPRALSRRIRYGVDPAEVLASRIGLPVIRLLAPPLHSPRRAGGDHSGPAPVFRLRRGYRGKVIVLDDVITSGSTVAAAIDAIGRDRVCLAVAANAVPAIR